MFVRTKRVKNTRGETLEYLVLVESVWDKGRVRQRTLVNLGRKDQLDPGQIDAMLKAMSPLGDKIQAINVAEGLGLEEALEYGPLPVLHRLWEDLGLGPSLRKALAGHAYTSPVEAAVFAMVASRIMRPASKLATSRWLSGVYWPGFDEVKLHHLYLGLDVLEEHKETIEADLWNRTLDLFALDLDLVLMDTTNVYFHGETAGDLAQFGHSKEKRFDKRLVSIALLVTKEGIPIGHEVLPGNTHDSVAFRKGLDALRNRFKVKRVIIAADRGMVSEKLLKELREAGLEYVVGVRMRGYRLAEDAISRSGARWQTITPGRLLVKTVPWKKERLLVCLNPEERKRDRAIRADILASLREELRTGSASGLIRNSRFRPFVSVDQDAVELDMYKVREAARYDGKYVLRTNIPELPSAEVATLYKQLWRVERAFRDLKGPLELRPVWHWTDPRIKGHVMVCFLAYAIEMAFQTSIQKAVPNPDAPATGEADYHEIMEDLSRLKVVTFNIDGRQMAVRTDLLGRAFDAFKAVGLRPPPKVLRDSKSDPGLVPISGSESAMP